MADITDGFFALPLWLLISGGGILGAIFGSFIGALVTRWPNGQSVIRGRSRCDHCGIQLKASELVPILSFWLSRGRCQSCRAKIDRKHFFAELSGTVIGLVAFAVLPVNQAVWTAILGWLLLPLAILDWRHLWLPDRLVGLLAAVGLLRLVILDSSSETLLSIAVAAGAFLLLEILRRVYRQLRNADGMGAGDPKLLGAIMLWLHWEMLPLLLLGSSGVGLLIILYRHEKTGQGKEAAVPFGTCLALTALLLFLWQGTVSI